MSFENGAIKSIKANHSYLRRGSDHFDRNKNQGNKRQLKWTGRKLEKGNTYRQTSQIDWTSFFKNIFYW